jgi:hypothetical protein
MPEIHRASFQPRERAQALVIHCSDPRFQAPFHDFLRRRLNLQTYELVAVPGGPQFLTLVDYLPKFSWAGWRWMKFLVDIGKPERVVLIAHEDCRWYLDGRFWQRGDVRQKQLADLAAIRTALRERFGDIPVESYFARLEGVEVFFEPVSP